MNRDEWKFHFSGKQVLTGAKAKKAFHESRLKFWQKCHDKTMIEVRVLSSVNSNAYHGPRVTVEAEFQAKLNESFGKIGEHGQRAKEYGGWIQVLESNLTRSYELHADDYLFFFGE